MHFFFLLQNNTFKKIPSKFICIQFSSFFFLSDLFYLNRREFYFLLLNYFILISVIKENLIFWFRVYIKLSFSFRFNQFYLIWTHALMGAQKKNVHFNLQKKCYKILIVKPQLNSVVDNAHLFIIVTSYWLLQFFL